jgi:hypothetical protein
MLHQRIIRLYECTYVCVNTQQVEDSLGRHPEVRSTFKAAIPRDKAGAYSLPLSGVCLPPSVFLPPPLLPLSAALSGWLSPSPSLPRSLARSLSLGAPFV